MDVTELKRRFSRREEKQLLKLASEVSRTEYPNPERAGCPSAETLKALAYRQIPLQDTEAIVDHIGMCSPCFAQYWDYRRGHKRRKGVTMLLLCLAIIALAGILVSRVGWRSHPQSKAEHQIAKDHSRPLSYRQLVLDLRAWSPSRSDQLANPRPELRLPREPIQLSIYLPIGSEDGTYDVQLHPPQQPPLLAIRGEARLQDHLEILEVRVDTSRLAPGSYILRLRLLPADWSEYPVKLE
jgi:hypothetical protein